MMADDRELSSTCDDAVAVALIHSLTRRLPPLPFCLGLLKTLLALSQPGQPATQLYISQTPRNEAASLADDLRPRGAE